MVVFKELARPVSRRYSCTLKVPFGPHPLEPEGIVSAHCVQSRQKFKTTGQLAQGRGQDTYTYLFHLEGV